MSQTIALLPTATPSPTPLPSGVVNADLVNLRSESNLNGELVGVANEGDAIEVVEISDDGQWLRVCCPGDEAEPAWISREFAEVEGIAPETIADAEAVAEQPDTVVATTAERDVSEPTGIVNADLINVRGGPGTNYAVVGQVRAGQEVAITGRDARGDWWEICCPAGQDTTSWLIGEYLDVLLPTGLTAESIALAQIPPTPEPPPVVQVAASGVGGVNPAVLAAAPAPGIPGAGGLARRVARIR